MGLRSPIKSGMGPPSCGHLERAAYVEFRREVARRNLTKLMVFNGAYAAEQTHECTRPHTGPHPLRGAP
jgi:hypothetical protein